MSGSSSAVVERTSRNTSIIQENNLQNHINLHLDRDVVGCPFAESVSAVVVWCSSSELDRFRFWNEIFENTVCP